MRFKKVVVVDTSRQQFHFLLWCEGGICRRGGDGCWGSSERVLPATAQGHPQPSVWDVHGG